MEMKKKADGFYVTGTKEEVMELLYDMRENFGKMKIKDYLEITSRGELDGKN